MLPERMAKILFEPPSNGREINSICLTLWMYSGKLIIFDNFHRSVLKMANTGKYPATAMTFPDLELNISFINKILQTITDKHLEHEPPDHTVYVTTRLYQIFRNFMQQVFY